MTDEELVKLIRSSPWSDGFPYLSQTADRIEALGKALRAWTETVATVMPEDFKDWHQNNPDEWPLVTVGVIKSLREQLDLFLD